MVAIVKRMRVLRALLAIRLGPGAAILPPEVARLHMEFAVDIKGGHRGAKKFWRDCLTRLKYHNPAIPMTINRTADQSGPAILTIHFTTSSSSRPSINSTTDSQTSDAPVAVTTPGPAVERTEVINMKFKDESEILSQLMTLTQAKPVKATLEETRQIEELKELRARTLKDSATMSAVNAKRKREENILAQARGEVEATRES